MNQPNIETEITQTLRVIRLLDGDLIASDVGIRICLNFEGSDKHPEIKSRLKAMMTWLTEYLNSSILYSVHTEHDTSLIEEISNNIVMCPDEPHDYILAMLIHSKISAFGGKDIKVESTTLEADTSYGFSQKVTGDVSLILPGMKDWIGRRHFHPVPWWSRTDSSTVDMKPEDGEDLTKIPDLGRELVSFEEPPTNVAVKKSAFKPRIITNDD